MEEKAISLVLEHGWPTAIAFGLAILLNHSIKLLRESTKERFEDMKSRISTLEAVSAECQKDRAGLRDLIITQFIKEKNNE